MNGRAIAEARTNIALVKYWGKRDAALNLPAVGSLSLTLDGLSTRTEVRFDSALAADALTLNGTVDAGKAAGRVSAFLDLIRQQAGITARAHVASSNNFPTAAGLASSASAFAALALAATRAAGLTLTGPELSVLARRGSGSAARSLFGGFVLMHRGERADGVDAFAEPIATPSAFERDLRMVVAVTTERAKETLSTDGMGRTAETSPYFAPWIATSAPDLSDALAAISASDLARLGEVAERSALTMHASALAARPAVVYFRGVTIEGFHEIARMRREGIAAWFTCDAGPHVKALTDERNADEVARRLSALPGVLSPRICKPGAPATVLE